MTQNQFNNLKSALRKLQYVVEILNENRFAGTDNNPHGIRDMLSSSVAELNYVEYIEIAHKGKS